MRHFHELTGWRVQAHNRYWSADTDYAAQNGGGYDFIVEDAMAIPTEQRFWDDLMYNGTAWGLAVYEQDWYVLQVASAHGVAPVPARLNPARALPAFLTYPRKTLLVLAVFAQPCAQAVQRV